MNPDVLYLPHVSEERRVSQVMSLDEVSKLYAGTALRRNTIKTLVHDGRIPSIKIGKRFLVRPADVEAFLAGQLPAPLPPLPEEKKKGVIRRIEE